MTTPTSTSCPSPRNQPTYVWSHEAYTLLRESYVDEYIAFLSEGTAAAAAAVAPASSSKPPSLPKAHDSNAKYTDARLYDGIVEYVGRTAVLYVGEMLFTAKRGDSIVPATDGAMPKVGALRGSVGT